MAQKARYLGLPFSIVGNLSMNMFTSLSLGSVNNLISSVSSLHLERTDSESSATSDDGKSEAV